MALDTAGAGGFGPGALPGVPLDEGFGFRRDVEVLVDAGVRLADLGGVSALANQGVVGSMSFRACRDRRLALHTHRKWVALNSGSPPHRYATNAPSSAAL